MAGAGLRAQTASCAPCHKKETQAFGHSGMARALESVKDCAILRANPKLAAKIGSYSYAIERVGDASMYTVTDGKDTVKVPIGWAFGQGAAGQTYLFERDGRWYESRVSYYAAIGGLDATLGAQGAVPRDLDEAAGRLTGPVDVGQCFDCHATHAVKATQLTLAAMTAGVQCERCHGSAGAHLAEKAPMRKLGKFSSEEMSDFCGQCHRTWSQIAMKGPRGVLNVRFQPYRLANSKCYSPEDDRIRCTACHDPHRDVETSAAAYDAKCTACHSAGARVCKVAKKDCVTCHMPRVELPGAHKRFTDHMIRIARANEKYPD
jgi:hypothetical protein